MFQSAPGVGSSDLAGRTRRRSGRSRNGSQGKGGRGILGSAGHTIRDRKRE